MGTLVEEREYAQDGRGKSEKTTDAFATRDYRVRPTLLSKSGTILIILQVQMGEYIPFKRRLRIYACAIERSLERRMEVRTQRAGSGTGSSALIALCNREEQHDDQLLNELLRCIKATETAEVSQSFGRLINVLSYE
jgi:hypothetical protein